MSFDWKNPYPTVRTPVFARNVVATSQPLASQAGLHILQRGGNAVDRRVVVTGLGLISPFGVGVERAWRDLLAGKSAARRIEHFQTDDLPCKIGMVMPPIRRVADPWFVISTLPDSFTLKAPFPVSASADTEMRPAPAVKEPTVMTWTVLSLV